MELNNNKPFEKPDAGTFAGTIIDVVDLPNYPTSFGPKNKIRIVWVLGGVMQGQKVLDSEGKPYQVIAMPNASMNEKSTLFKVSSQILGQAPPLITTTEQLSQLLIGRSNTLFLTKTPNPKVQGDFYVNVAGIGPLMPGVPAPPVPQGFIRQKDRPKVVAGPTGQGVATYSQPPAQPQPTFNQQPPPFAPAPTAMGVGPVPAAPQPNRVSF